MENSPAPKPKEDQRVRLTKTLIQNAFLELLAEKPVQAVTVKELCQRADVNRGTFYLHYKDVYDLLQQMEEALLADLDGILDRTPVIVQGEPPAEASEFTANIVEFFSRNGELCAILLGDNGDRRFVAAIVERAREHSVKEYQRRYPATSARDIELFYYFIAWGFIGLLQRSIRSPRALPFAAVAEGAQRIITQASRFLTIS